MVIKGIVPELRCLILLIPSTLTYTSVKDAVDNAEMAFLGRLEIVDSTLYMFSESALRDFCGTVRNYVDVGQNVLGRQLVVKNSVLSVDEVLFSTPRAMRVQSMCRMFEADYDPSVSDSMLLDTESVVLDFGATYEITHLRAKFELGASHAIVETSVDNTNWTPALDLTGTIDSVYAITPVDTRYIRVTASGTWPSSDCSEVLTAITSAALAVRSLPNTLSKALVIPVINIDSVRSEDFHGFEITSSTDFAYVELDVGTDAVFALGLDVNEPPLLELKSFSLAEL